MKLSGFLSNHLPDSGDLVIKYMFSVYFVISAHWAVKTSLKTKTHRFRFTLSAHASELYIENCIRL